MHDHSGYNGENYGGGLECNTFSKLDSVYYSLSLVILNDSLHNVTPHLNLGVLYRTPAPVIDSVDVGAMMIATFRDVYRGGGEPIFFPAPTIRFNAGRFGLGVLYVPSVHMAGVEYTGFGYFYLTVKF